MAHNHMSNHRRMDNYEYELKKLMEQERRSMAGKVDMFSRDFMQ